ncbi:Pyridoxine 5'-phosphate synthase [Planctomycetes bacterium Pan216]|uniref:Pyridoxine 5'-phosphate synthase n=1 Tax=Kolteria novifilia TaxID=2527975 RepID=A0A518B462_9BACT|nr:Pyridoxine 5'-phosphate synthase [Planctomycetes bacterium Pan216]
MARLGVNIDHVATIRQARRGREPDPVWAAAAAELGGADVITLHLREDRRHIQDRDLRILRETVQVKLNLEMAATEEMVAIALEVRPDKATLVPERREEITTEGGLDIVGNRTRIEETTKQLREGGIEVSHFIDPVTEQVDASRATGADAVELHTGAYANAIDSESIDKEFRALVQAANVARTLELTLHLGHGLNYVNTTRVLAIPEIDELNIGHSIVSRAVFVGMTQAVREMKEIIVRG